MTVVINGTTGVSGVAGSASTPALIGSDADSGYYINSANEPNASVNGTAVWSAASTFGFKNRLINGAMVIDQRNAGASVSFAGGNFPVDRMRLSVNNNGSGTANAQQNLNSLTPPTGFTNYIGMTVTNGSSMGASEAWRITQRIEGYSVSDLGWGASGAAPATLSFWVRSNLTGTFGGSVSNNAGDRAYVFSYTISAANTWEYKTVTIAGDTSGTWLKTNGIGILLSFSVGCGSSVQGTAGVWGSTYLDSVTGQTNVVATTSNTFYITGIQFEKGSTATSFDFRPYGTELALCQRYCPVFVGGGSGVITNFLGQAYSSTNVLAQIKLPVTTRVPPTGITATAGNFTVYGSTLTGVTCSSITFNNGDTDTAGIVFAIGSSSLTAGNASLIQQNNGATPRLIFTGCEL